MERGEGGAERESAREKAREGDRARDRLRKQARESVGERETVRLCRFANKLTLWYVSGLCIRHK